MKKTQLGSKRKRLIMILLSVAALFALAASWTMAKSNGARQPTLLRDTTAGSTSANQDEKWSKAILSVSNMTCGGCIATIKKGAAGLPGTGNVNVDLASSSAEVLYDANLIKDPKIIAKTITDSGYPAKIKQIIAARQLGKELTEASELAKTHIAKVGRIDIPRKDFEIELGHAQSRYQQIYGADTFSTPQGKQLLQRIRTQITLGMVDAAIKFQEVDRVGYTLQDDKIDSALTSYAQQKKVTLAQLEKDLDANGYPFVYFKRKFAQRITLQNYLEENVLADSVDPDDRQKRYGNWLANARSLAKVVYYDKNLETLVKAASGGGCGGGGGSSCSVSK